MSDAQNSPLLTVVIATCNRDRYLELALRGVVASRYRNLEVIVTDDGAASSTRALVESFNDPRMRYRSNPSRLGMAQNHLMAFGEMKGEFFTVLNDDDEWTPDFPGRLVAVLVANPDVAVAFSDHYVIDATGRIDPQETDRNTKRWRRDVLASGKHRPFHQALIHHTIPMAQASVVRRNAIDWSDFPIETGTHYDLWLTYLAARTGAAAYYLPERLTRYRVHPASDTAMHNAEKAQASIFVWSRFLKDGYLTDCRSVIRHKYAWSHIQYGIDLLRVGRCVKARQPLLEGLRARPQARGLVALVLSLTPSRISRLALRYAGFK